MRPHRPRSCTRSNAPSRCGATRVSGSRCNLPACARTSPGDTAHANICAPTTRHCLAGRARARNSHGQNPGPARGRSVGRAAARTRAAAGGRVAPPVRCGAGESRQPAGAPRELLRAVQGCPSPAAAVQTTGSTRPRRISTEVLPAAPGEAQAAPDSTDNLVALLDWHVRAHPERPHITVNEASLTSGDEQEETLSYAALQAGGPQVAARRRATLLITVPEARPLAQLLRAQTPELRHVVTVAQLSSAVLNLSELEQIGAAVRTQDIAFLQYTSGSTGHPKGVILTHANLLANIRAMGQAVQADASDVFVSWLPLYHDMGLIGAWLGSLYYAIPLVVMSPLIFLTRPQRWLWAIHRHRATLSARRDFAFWVG